MNIENIASLSSMLSKAGFENLSYQLLQHICCQPVRFTISQELIFGSDHLCCQLSFERKGADYSIAYYEASMRKDLAMPALTINQVGLQQLESAMQAIEWNLSSVPSVFRIDDESTWEREKQIEKIINELSRLSASTDGKAYADILKVRFWSGTLLEQLNGSLNAVRSKLEVSQRFYFIDGGVISVNEALRFLQNKWLEKKLQARKKADTSNEDNESFSDGGKGVKLLKKKRIGRAGKIQA